MKRPYQNNRIAPVGERFGQLTVLEYAGKRDKWSHSFWKCRCDCGREHVATASSIRYGKTRSCGCSMVGKERQHDERDRQIVSMRQEGKSMGRIGAILGITRNAVAGVIYRSRRMRTDECIMESADSIQGRG